VQDDSGNRISVLRDSHLVPLLPSTQAVSRKQPWQGVLLERHAVTAIEIPEHEHRDFCLHLQVSGTDSMEWWSEGRHNVERTAPGSIILLPPGTRDRILWHGDSQRLILSFEAVLLNRITEESGAGAAQFKGQWSLQDTPLQRLVSEMGREAEAGWPLGSLYADLVATSFASMLLRRHAADKVTLADRKGGLPMPRLRHAMEYISANLEDDLRLEEIANQVNVSPFHFAREFRSATGQTPYQYLLDQRIGRAKLLLRTRSWLIQEIAQMTGFRSAVNFIRAFRQRTGQTPAIWRQSA
jgi:AraC family transcriptional regulator